MIKEAENIILNKEYYELSTEELAAVSELVGNAEEFEDMKWFLASTQQVLVSDKVEASGELKTKVMTHLNQPAEKRRFWLNGVIPFLLPEDKKFYQKPAFQMSLAAVLIIGFIMISSRSFKNSSVALNDRNEIQEKTIDFDISDKDAEAEKEMTPLLLDEQPIELEPEVTASLSDEVLLLEEAEEVEEIALDGYYEGELSDDDLKKIEDNKRRNDKSDLSSTFANNDDAGGSVDRVVALPVVDDAVNQTVISGNSDLNNEPVVESKELGAIGGVIGKDKSKKDRRKKYNKTGQAPGFSEGKVNSGADNKKLKPNDNFRYDSNSVPVTEDDAEWTKDEKEQNAYKEIKPFSLHVNETKELNKLFKVYK